MMTIESIAHEIGDMDHTDSKIIVLWGDDNLLFDAVDAVLNAKSNWKVIRLSDELEDSVVVSEVKRARPDVFILHKGVFLEKLHLLKSFTQDFSKLKVITINFENNQVGIYTRQTISVGGAFDLLSIVGDDINSEMKGGEITP